MLAVSYEKRRAREMFGWIPPNKRNLNPFLIELSKQKLGSVAELKAFVHSITPSSSLQTRKVRQGQNVSELSTNRQRAIKQGASAKKQMRPRNSDMNIYKQKVRSDKLKPVATTKQAKNAHKQSQQLKMPMSLSQTMTFK